MYGSKFARGLAVATLIAGLSTGAMAQATTPPAAAPAAPAPAAPALPPLSDSHLAAALDVVRLSGMSRSIDVIVPETIVRARAAFTRMRPELSEEIGKAVADLMPEFALMSNEAQKLAATAFGHRLSEAELGELKKFFSSDAGKKFVEAQPAIIEEMYRNLDQFTNVISQSVIDKLRDELKKRGHTI